jgi:hypothetical protein
MAGLDPGIVLFRLNKSTASFFGDPLYVSLRQEIVFLVITSSVLYSLTYTAAKY